MPTPATAHLVQEQENKADEVQISKVTRKMPSKTADLRQPDKKGKEISIDQILDTLQEIDIAQEQKAQTQKMSDLSLEQKAAFAYWLTIFDIRNPRQVERVHNSYQQILFTEIAGDTGDKVPHGYNKADFIKLKSLCALEFIHSLWIDNKDALKQEFMEGKFIRKEILETFKAIDQELFSHLHSVIHILERQDGYDRKKFLQEIETFVLP